MNILLLNAGSSSLKCVLMDSRDGSVIVQGSADWASKTTRYRFKAGDSQAADEVVSWSGYTATVRHFVAQLAQFGHAKIDAVGHRIVHGGKFTSSVKITPEVRNRIAALVELAPLHNPPSLETLAAAESELPNAVHVAVFDTSFHATLPREAYTYPLPHKWTQDWGIRKFGFHGLSHAYCAQRAAEMLNRPLTELRLVICHLGHGCSAAAVKHGRCIDTTMGFTPLDGLMMATRSGSIDPGIISLVQERYGLTPRQVEHTLNHHSGLLGVSSVSADMREVITEAKAGNDSATLAIAIYSYRVRQAVGAFAVTMGGIDALVFTAGVGENAGEIRESTCTGLACLGMDLDLIMNSNCRPDADIALRESRARILVIATREDVTMYREVMQVIA